jgi:2-(1,2-epoxy-1,2-dihydrophenyl)acetyl-CoA isomerase
MIEGNYAGFRLEIKDPHIALITFDQPERLNGLTAAMKRDLVEVMLQLQYDEAARVVVVTGEGRAFCAGDDIGGGYSNDAQWQHARSAKINRTRTDGLGSYGSLRSISQAVNRAIRDLDKITIAAVNGIAIQSGLSIALACDFRIASRTAKLGSATLRFGFLPDEGGHHLLVRHIGVAKTLDFLMRKRIVDGPQALELGLVHEVVEPGELMPRSMELAREFAHGPQVAMRLLKRAIYSAADLTFDQAGDDIATKTGISDHHPDTKEGMAAWREKRPPRFNGD